MEESKLIERSEKIIKLFSKKPTKEQIQKVVLHLVLIEQEKTDKIVALLEKMRNDIYDGGKQSINTIATIDWMIKQIKEGSFLETKSYSKKK